MDRIMRQAEVLYLTGLSRASLDRAEKESRFPKRKKLSPRAIGWLQSEVQAWIEGRNEVAILRPEAENEKRTEGQEAEAF